MAYTLTEFTEIIQFSVLQVYHAFYVLAITEVFQDGGVTISLLDIMVGFLALGLIIDRVMKYFGGE
jgi:hypothetical protein